jgi:hypothetical protein
MFSRSTFIYVLIITAFVFIYNILNTAVDLNHYEAASALALYFFLFVTSASFSRGKLRDGFLVLSSLLFGLLLTETIAVSLERPPIHLFSKGLFANRPLLGTGPGAGVFFSKKIDAESGGIIYDVKYTIDDPMLRRTRSSESGPTIAFFGDSVTFGEGVNDDATMPQAFADLTDHAFKVLNFGSSGYGPQQYLRSLDSGIFDRLLNQDLRLIIYTTAPWHAERIACKPAYTLPGPRYELVNGKAIFKGACASGLNLKLRLWLSNTAIYRTFIERAANRVTHEDIELYIAAVLDAIAIGQEKYHAPTLLLFLPFEQNYLAHTGFTNAEIISRFQARGVKMLDVALLNWKDQASLRIKGDGHPTPLAHRARAALLNQFLVENMPQVLSRERAVGTLEPIVMPQAGLANETRR